MAPRRRPAAAKAVPRIRNPPHRREANVAPKAKARAAPRSLGGSRKRAAKPEAQHSAGWIALQDYNPQVGQQLHMRGTYRGERAEIVGEVGELVEDKEGEWMKINLTGSTNAAIQEWRKQHLDGFFANRKPRVKALDPDVEGLLCVEHLREVDPLLSWKANLVDLQGGGPGLPGLEAVARDLGYGVDPGGVAAPPPVIREPAENSKPKRLKGKARVKNMIKISKWDWHGSSLDPGFRRPRISLKRKKEESRSSESSVASTSHEASDQEDLFPEEAQAKHISRKCPGLLAKFAIKAARERLLMSVGESGEHQTPSPTFVKYYQQIFAHSGASTPMKREYLTLAVCLDSLLFQVGC